MKKILTILLLIALTMLSGCEPTPDYKQSESTLVTETGVQFVGEWVSPDGVHYWVIDGASRFGLAPRYNSEGELVIEKGE